MQTFKNDIYFRSSEITVDWAKVNVKGIYGPVGFVYFADFTDPFKTEQPIVC